MKPLWAALGIILLLSSIFVVLYANANTWERSEIDWTVDPAPVEVLSSWNISRVLNQGDWFKLEISPSVDWNEALEPAGGDYAVPYKPSFVNVTDPYGNETEFLCEFLRLSNDETAALVFYNITITERHGIGNIRFELPYGTNKPGIVAQTLSGGNYTARVTWLFGGGSPPYRMRLLQGTLIKRVYDYSNFYPVGLGLFAVSAVLLVYGFKDAKKVTRRKR
jgi:hypothetical protein